MIAHTSLNKMVDEATTQRSGFRIWLTLAINSERGNLVLGATIPRLLKLCECGRAVLVDNLIRMQDGDVIQWDRDKAVIRINPYLFWNGSTFNDDQHRTALREWDSVPRDEYLYEYIQRILLWPEDGADGFGFRGPRDTDKLVANDHISKFTYQPDEPQGYREWRNSFKMDRAS